MSFFKKSKIRNTAKDRLACTPKRLTQKYSWTVVHKQFLTSEKNRPQVDALYGMTDWTGSSG